MDERDIKKKKMLNKNLFIQFNVMVGTEIKLYRQVVTQVCD